MFLASARLAVFRAGEVVTGPAPRAFRTFFAGSVSLTSPLGAQAARPVAAKRSPTPCMRRRSGRPYATHSGRAMLLAEKSLGAAAKKKLEAKLRAALELGAKAALPAPKCWL